MLPKHSGGRNGDTQDHTQSTRVGIFGVNGTSYPLNLPFRERQAQPETAIVAISGFIDSEKWFKDRGD